MKFITIIGLPHLFGGKRIQQFCSEFQQLLLANGSYRTLSGCNVGTIFLFLLDSGVFETYFFTAILFKCSALVRFPGVRSGFGKWIKLVPTSQESKWEKHSCHYESTSAIAHPQEVLKSLIAGQKSFAVFFGKYFIMIF